MEYVLKTVILKNIMIHLQILVGLALQDVPVAHNGVAMTVSQVIIDTIIHVFKVVLLGLIFLLKQWNVYHVFKAVQHATHSSNALNA